ncbi:unnamed protein product [Rhizopus stolonifer]
MHVQKVELCPNLAKVDFDVRVVGQAVSNTSGGSSESPVIDIHGNSVALQAGGNDKAATDFFLPLDRVKRALEHIQKGEQVPRESESKLRELFTEEVGVLVVEVVVPEGPAYTLLEEGDIFLSINDEYCTKFVPFENTMDSNVDKEVTVITEHGGKILEFKIRVGNLHEITPDRFVEFGVTILHELSYQLASHYCVPCKGVYVADTSGIFRLEDDDGWIIKSIDDKETPDLNTFIEMMKTIPDYARVSCVYYSIADVHSILGGIISIDRHWNPFRLAVHNDHTGLWDYTELG